MEASQAGLAGDAAQGAEGGSEAVQYATADQFNQLASGQQELLQYLRDNQAQPVQQEQEAEPEAQPEYDFSFMENEGYDTGVAEQLAGVFNQQLGPLQQQLREAQEIAKEARETAQRLHIDREADVLATEIPELQDEAVFGETLKTANQLLENNPGWDRSLINDPNFWRIAHYARRAAEQANQGDAEQSPAAHLEGGGGATPASAQVDHAQQLIEAARGGSSVLPF